MRTTDRGPKPMRAGLLHCGWVQVGASLQRVGELVSDPILWVLSVVIIALIVWIVMETIFDYRLRNQIRKDYYLQRFLDQQTAARNLTHNNNSVDSRQLTLTRFCLTFTKFTLNKWHQIIEKYKSALRFCAKIVEKYKFTTYHTILLIIRILGIIIIALWYFLTIIWFIRVLL